MTEEQVLAEQRERRVHVQQEIQKEPIRNQIGRVQQELENQQFFQFPDPVPAQPRYPPGGAGGGQTDHAAAQSLTPGPDPEPGPASPARRKVKSNVLRRPVPEQEPGILIFDDISL